jgi:hypothetical protein
MKIPHGNTMENSGNENPKMGFKPPDQSMKRARFGRISPIFSRENSRKGFRVVRLADLFAMPLSVTPFLLQLLRSIQQLRLPARMPCQMRFALRSTLTIIIPL